jgi:cellulose synthase/poly-beta-1,6-N-acetylglucosamine synthase-like glycosyltransferase
MSDEFFNNIGYVIGFLAVLLTLPGTVELLFLNLGGLIRPKARQSPESLQPSLRIAVVVPAHNEETGIQRTVRSLLACPGVGSRDPLVVVADNCTDATASKAKEAGAEVLERTQPDQRGKGYALQFAFEKVLSQNVDAILVIDADTLVEPNLMVECKRVFAGGVDGVQVRYLTMSRDKTFRSRLVQLAVLAFNHLRPLARESWGVSVGILGNGFALTRDTLQSVPFLASGITEDLEYHLALVKAGRRIQFTDATTVRSDLPTNSGGATDQRARWEGGRFRLMLERIPGLLLQVLKGQWRFIEPLFELLLLPLSFHVLLLLMAFILGPSSARLYAIAALGVVAGHVVLALRKGGGGAKELFALMGLPVFLIWKIILIPLLGKMAKKNAQWVRTERSSSISEMVAFSNNSDGGEP